MPGDEFDAYYKWFGIPPAEQPADHYRLLGVTRFEDDADVIENSADARMASLQSRKTGSHSLLAEKLMNEVTQARICLLSPERKSAYDKALQAESAPQPGDETPASGSEPAAFTQQPAQESLQPYSQDLFNDAGFGATSQGPQPYSPAAPTVSPAPAYGSTATGYRPRKKSALRPRLPLLALQGCVCC